MSVPRKIHGGPGYDPQRPPSEPEAPEVDVVTLVKHARLAASGRAFPDADADMFMLLAAALEATAAERDRAHATLREIADDPYPGRGAHHVRLARERLDNP